MCVCVGMCMCLWVMRQCTKAAVSHPNINIVERWKQESVCF